MALFTDGPPTTMGELQQYENAILNVANTENINTTTKAILAQAEIATELLFFLDRNSLWDPRVLIRPSIGLSDVVVTEPLKRWHAYKTLAMVYRDAYNNQLNDRYQGKWTQYEELSQTAEQTLFGTGVGIVHQPIPRAAQPTLSVLPMAVSGVSYYVCASWVGPSGQEGLVSDVVQAASSDGSAVIVGLSSQPSGIGLWNVYAGDAPDNVTLQNNSPLLSATTWTLPATGLTKGKAPGSGQKPEWWIVDRHIIPRG